MSGQILAVKPTKKVVRPPAQLGEVVMYCEGSMHKPVVRRSKPCCPVCGQAFHWHDLVDRVQFCPEH